LGFAACAAVSATAIAQESAEQPTVHHHHYYYPPHHTVHHHHYMAHGPAVAPGPVPGVATSAPAPQAAPFGLSWPHIAPYPDGKGDEDGLSEDTDDCNKGCIDGTAN
jgi:hypothetical protein